MKILWVNSLFLHPTTKGGQIRTLEMLRWLSRQHEIHYVAGDEPDSAEGLVRSGEYCARAFPVAQRVPGKRSPRFAVEVAAGLFSPVPVSIRMRRSARMYGTVRELLRWESYDALVCDFLTPAINLPDLGRWILFQHNVETMIWRRAAERARHPLSRAYFALQARRMFEHERRICRAVRHVVAVSETDAAWMRENFGVAAVSSVPTGVDVEYFARPASTEPVADLVFVGSMDWLANIDGVTWFLREVLPLIRARRPRTSVAIVGRNPSAEIRRWAERDPLLRVTGTVPDVRPYFWGAPVSIVPLRIGGGTRLKIFEAMAAGAAVVSTAIGAEGLEVRPGVDLRLADGSEDFARHCLELLGDREASDRMAAAARAHVTARFSWSSVAAQFQEILSAAAASGVGQAA